MFSEDMETDYDMEELEIIKEIEADDIIQCESDEFCEADECDINPRLNVQITMKPSARLSLIIQRLEDVLDYDHTPVNW